MGFIEKREDKKIPDGMDYLFDTYKDIRFSITDKGKLSPRKEIGYSDLLHYQEVMKFDLSPTECSVILSVDAIFNANTQ